MSPEFNPTSTLGRGGGFGSFGQSAATGGGLFGSAASGGIFGGGDTSASAGGLFGQASNTFAAPGTNDDAGNELVQEEEVTEVAGWTPEFTAELVSANIGEEDEECIYEQRSKLYRFKDDEWKERGLGTAKLLKSKDSGYIRFLMRQEKTEKVVANHYVIPANGLCEIASLGEVLQGARAFEIRAADVAV